MNNVTDNNSFNILKRNKKESGKSVDFGTDSDFFQYGQVAMHFIRQRFYLHKYMLTIMQIVVSTCIFIRI